MVKVKLRKGPVCRGTLSSGAPCGAPVERPADRCPACLERVAVGPDVEARRRLAADASLPPAIFGLLAADPDVAVRLAVARREGCPLVVLQELEHDDHPGVRTAATGALSTAFAPRALQEPDDLFSPADLDAWGGDGGPGTPAPGAAPGLPGRVAATDGRGQRGAGPRHAAGALARRHGPAAPDGAPADEVLSRIDALSTRLSSLESVLASTSERLGAIADRLEELGEPLGAHGAPPGGHQLQRRVSR